MLCAAILAGPLLSVPAICGRHALQAIVLLLNVSLHQLQSEALCGSALNHHGPLGGALHRLVRRQEGPVVLHCSATLLDPVGEGMPRGSIPRSNLHCSLIRVPLPPAACCL